MALSFFQKLFCCSNTPPIPETQGQYDESSHLIPRIIEPPVNQDQAYIDYFNFQARLNEIVRAKQGKMVNVASNFPFNLHNRLIPVETSVSRSISEPPEDEDEDDEAYHPSQTYYDVYTNRTSARKRRRNPNPHFDHDQWFSTAPSSRITEHDFTSDRRSRSPTAVQPRPRPTLNIRLVTHIDIAERGRQTARGPNPSGLPLIKNAFEEASSGQSSDSSQSSEPRKLTPADVQFYNIGPLTMSWGD